MLSGSNTYLQASHQSSRAVRVATLCLAWALSSAPTPSIYEGAPARASSRNKTVKERPIYRYFAHRSFTANIQDYGFEPFWTGPLSFFIKLETRYIKLTVNIFKITHLFTSSHPRYDFSRELQPLSNVTSRWKLVSTFRNLNISTSTIILILRYQKRHLWFTCRASRQET